MFKKILIANRGEIALRIIRACKELGVQSVAIYSEPDIHSLHVQLADEAICIGPAASSDSYLKIDRIISAAEIADVDAIHPGYGFLAENAHFADVCASCNIKFIGPTAQAIRMMGDKNSARDCARAAGVPISPGSDGIIADEAEALRVARKIGYPVMIKAVAGGGGRGMRIASNEGSLVQGYHAARMEAEKAFGNGAVYIEKFIVNPRDEIAFKRMVKLLPGIGTRSADNLWKSVAAIGQQALDPFIGARFLPLPIRPVFQGTRRPADLSHGESS